MNHDLEQVAVASLTPHPENYRRHPPEQIRHLKQSLTEHGQYRNVVVAEDGTILAGHGVVEAAKALKLKQIGVVRLPIAPDSPEAKKLLVADNELASIAESDQALLAGLLRGVADDGDLLGTGVDDQRLLDLERYVASLAAGPVDAAAIWGSDMPAYRSDDKQSPYHCTVHFRTNEDADRFFEMIGQQKKFSVWWPESDGHVGSDRKYEYAAAQPHELDPTGQPYEPAGLPPRAEPDADISDAPRPQHWPADEPWPPVPPGYENVSRGEPRVRHG